MRKLYIIAFILFCVYKIYPQKFGSRSAYEKRWAVFHPFAAIRVKNIYRKCLPVYESVKQDVSLDHYENGGKADAFRHSFFMAAFSQKIRTKKIRKLGIAHEKGNYRDFLKSVKENGEIPDSLSSVMDLHNNELGLRIGKQYKKADLNVLAEYVRRGLMKGEDLYFKRNANGQYLTCNGEIIPIEKYSGQWFIPKCLISTNEK